jgi:hypothetical protein
MCDIKKLYKNNKSIKKQQSNTKTQACKRAKYNTCNIQDQPTNNSPKTVTKVKYKTWKQFLSQHFGHLLQTSHIVKYVWVRMELFKAFEYEKIRNALLDFTTAFYLTSRSVEEQEFWITCAQTQLITIHDIEYAYFYYYLHLTLFNIIFV